MDEIGQFEQNWTIRTELDNMDNFDKIGQFGQFRKKWTIWKSQNRTKNGQYRTKLDIMDNLKLHDKDKIG